MQKYGEVAWGDVSTENGPSKSNRDSFLRLEKGSNIVRVITSPYQYSLHRYKLDNDPGYGTRVMCSASNGSCALCDLGDKPKRRWLLGVIDRKTRSYRILDISVAVFKGIQQLTRDEEWGSPINYDIDIKVDPNGGASGYYQVVPKVPRPLSADDTQIKDMVDLDELKRRCLPPTPDKVQEKLDDILSGQPARPSMPRPQNSKPMNKVPVMDTSNDEDEDDFSFPRAGT